MNGTTGEVICMFINGYASFFSSSPLSSLISEAGLEAPPKACIQITTKSCSFVWIFDIDVSSLQQGKPPIIWPEKIHKKSLWSKLKGGMENMVQPEYSFVSYLWLVASVGILVPTFVFDMWDWDLCVFVYLCSYEILRWLSEIVVTNLVQNVIKAQFLFCLIRQFLIS